MENVKAYYDKFDIKKRYNVGIGTALNIIRTIRFFNGGGSLPPGKILPRELANWESRDEFNRRVFIPYEERISAEELCLCTVGSGAPGAASPTDGDGIQEGAAE